MAYENNTDTHSRSIGLSRGYILGTDTLGLRILAQRCRELGADLARGRRHHYSLLTNYELGPIKLLSMRTHLWLDLASGVFLALSPWIFRFNDYVYVPHVVLGLLEITASMMTDPTPYANAARRHATVHPRAH